MATKYQVRDDVTSVSVGEHELEIVDGVLVVENDAEVAALAIHERDGLLVRMPDEKPASKPAKPAKGDKADKGK